MIPRLGPRWCWHRCPFPVPCSGTALLQAPRGIPGVWGPCRAGRALPWLCGDIVSPTAGDKVAQRAALLGREGQGFDTGQALARQGGSQNKQNTKRAWSVFLCLAGREGNQNGRNELPEPAEQAVAPQLSSAMLWGSPAHLQPLLSWAPALPVLCKAAAADKCHGLQCHPGHISSRAWSSSASSPKGRYDCKPRCAEGTGASFPQPSLPPCVSFPAFSLCPQQSRAVFPWTSPGSCWQGSSELAPARWH